MEGPGSERNDPPGEDFSASDLSWTKFKNEEYHDNVSLIPYDRVDALSLESSVIWNSQQGIGVPLAWKIMEKVVVFYQGDDIVLTLKIVLLDSSP
ncbi:hypothetical protein CQW23_26086 [Capsicum baccatum]|uniref:Uncharacterized protein n=1 Tax=Capsicum baccatum TaxID=33114 RepID=A0A2G2VMS9_CAPBA|nr:hypothetical protein CQW23_26086 [Capsicum baccatum]